MDDDNIHFDCFWEELQRLARRNNERVLDRDAWRESFDEGQSAADAFYEEYPEHKPAA